MSHRRFRHLVGLAAASLTLLVAAGCSGGEPVTARGTTTLADPARAESPDTGAPGRFDGLSARLRLRSTTVQQGRTLRSRAVIENATWPGDYLAVLDIRGLTQRLEYPVAITP